jgi:hypothetical protein
MLGVHKGSSLSYLLANFSETFQLIPILWPMQVRQQIVEVPPKWVRAI